jgi:DUF4097 and DUF4098 domain-containing protein YvlB
MRLSLLAVLTALVLPLPFAAPTASAQERTKSGTVALDADGRVRIDNHEGRIRISTWDRTEVKYTADIQPQGDEDEAKRTSVEVTSSSSRFEMRTVHDESDDGWGGSDIMPVHYTLTVPRTARVSIEDHESEMEIEGLRAGLAIDTHEGPITVRDHQGDLEIDAHDSPVTIDGLTGELEIDTHEGDLEITGFRGELDVDNHDAEVEVIFAALTDDVDIDTHDGRATLTLPADAGFSLAADLGDDTNLDGDYDLSGLRDDDNDYRGDVQGGGPRIRLSAHDGDFRLLKRE